MTTVEIYSRAGAERAFAARGDVETLKRRVGTLEGAPAVQGAITLFTGEHAPVGTRSGTLVLREKAALGDGIAVRAVATGRAQAGVGDPLTAAAEPGDLAVLIMAAQLQADPTPSPVPEGWTGTWQNTVPGGTRSGYVAVKKVISPTDTRGVEWWVKTKAWTARQRAVLVVLAGADADRAVVGPWSATVAGAATTRLLVSAAHGTKDNKMAAWTLDGGVVVADGLADVSTTESWSAVRAVLGGAGSVPDGIGANPPAAWAQVGLVPGGAGGGGGGGALDGATVPLWLGGEQTRAGVSIMPYGARSASALKERKGIVVGHRGMSGAGDVVEHTMAAYTRAVECGVDALEISCHRTSDGVWFASHDSTLARLGGPSTPIRDMTWAQVRSAFAGRPEALPVTLRDYLAAYGGTHVTIFDPKTEMARSDEYLALLAPYKDRVVVKAFADSGWLFAKVRQAGWATWGYAYARNRGQNWYPDFAAGTNLDFLSMEWDAADDVWAPLVATGKPVIAHIPASAAQAAEGARKGAAGCITSRADLVAGLKV
jgi:hypothetical protein|nr:MAG TPA: hypothetical protein [Caudoviricetes sp.]